MLLIKQQQNNALRGRGVGIQMEVGGEARIEGTYPAAWTLCVPSLRILRNNDVLLSGCWEARSSNTCHAGLGVFVLAAHSPVQHKMNLKMDRRQNQTEG